MDAEQQALTGIYSRSPVGEEIVLERLDTGAPAKEGAVASLPSIFTALKEKLGLRLTAKKGPVTTWVVVRAEKPDDN